MHRPILNHKVQIKRYRIAFCDGRLLRCERNCHLDRTDCLSNQFMLVTPCLTANILSRRKTLESRIIVDMNSLHSHIGGWFLYYRRPHYWRSLRPSLKYRSYCQFAHRSSHQCFKCFSDSSYI